MRARSLSHLSDGALVRELKSLVGREREGTASVVAHMAEVDARRLYAPAGYPSMFKYCIQELHLSEDAAYKRIQAARAVRRFPAILNALADGRLHLSGVKLLAPYLTRENAEELLGAAAGRTRRGIEELLAERFPQTESMPMVEATPPLRDSPQQAPGPVQNETVDPAAIVRADAGAAAQAANSPAACPGSPTDGVAAARANGNVRTSDTAQQAPGPVESADRLAPVAAGRFTLRLTMSRATHEKLQHAQALLSHRIPAGDLAQVLDRVLDPAVEQLEKQKLAKTSKPRRGQPRTTTSTRHVPAHVKRTVWERDGGSCTFVSASGKRCGSRRFLEFDHVLPFAKGGGVSIDNLRLRCRAHNQFEAERVFGAGFMREQRERGHQASRRMRMSGSPPPGTHALHPRLRRGRGPEECVP